MQGIKNSSFIRGIAADTTKSLGIRIGGIAVTTGLHVVLARVMLQSEYGSYLFALNLATLSAVLAQAGLPNSAVRFLSQYVAQEKWDDWRGFLSVALKIVTALSFALVALWTLALMVYPSVVEQDSLSTVYLSLLFIPVLALLHLVQECVRGCRMILLSQVFEQLLVPLVMFAVVALIVVVDSSPVAIDVLLAHVALSFFAILFVGWRLLLFIKGRSVVNDYSNQKNWLTVSGSLFLTSAVSVLLVRLDVLVLGILGSMEIVAPYAVAMKVATFLAFGAGAIVAAAGPRVSALYHQGDMVGLQTLVSVTVRWSFLWTLVASTVVILFSKEILSVFGTAYADQWPVLWMLVVGQLFNAYAGLVTLLFSMTGHQNDYVRVLLYSLSAHFVALPLGYHFHGTIGVAVVVSGTMVFWNSWLILLSIRKLGINPVFTLGSIRY